MSDSKTPRPGQPQYLPRTWKPDPEPTADEPPAGPVAPKKKKKKAVDAAPVADAPKKKKKKVEAEATDDGSGGPKLEETPLLDTYEARQRVRIALGSVAGLVALVILFVAFKRFQGATADAEKPTTSPEPSPVAVDPKESAEKEAAVLLDSAKQQDKLGHLKPALALLQKVTRIYEGTAAAREAVAALDRDRRNRPLFEVEEPKKAANTAAPSVAGVAPAPSPPAPAAVTPPPPSPPPIVARALPSQYYAEADVALHPTGWPLRIIGSRDGMPLVLVLGGEFMMGRHDGESTERPAHRVRLGTFYIDEHEVTNRQYQTYLKESGRTPEAVPPERLDLPVVSITASDAQSYCRWANRRLPTEAQWEYAARSGDGRIGYGAALKLGDPKAPLRPALSEPADRSPFGAFDMASNAAEWTSDYFDPNFFSQAGPLSIEPTGPRTSRVKPPFLVVKGHSPAGILTDREGVAATVRPPYLGFRGVLAVEPLASPAANNPAPGPADAGAPANSASGVTPF